MNIQGQGHSLTLVQGLSDMKVKTCFFVTKFHMKMFRSKKMKINKYGFGHMNNMAAVPYKVKTL